MCAVRHKGKNASRLNVIWVVQSWRKKYLAFLFPQISAIPLPSRPYHEGRFAIVTNVGRGMRWTLWRRKTNGA